ncbi:hypothetical protein [Helicobacter rodentium]|uniref:hypothetical protein n=1 Tax=Helicobacter rodentium TaxID=59617 RepID=UPI0023525270|nr:hypothetical protein [Helicobacter rodentium]
MQNTKNSIMQSGLKRNLGQFFSPKILVKQCISLIQNKKGRLYFIEKCFHHLKRVVS